MSNSINHPELTVERLSKYSQSDASGLGHLMPYLSETFSDEPIDETLLRSIISSEYHEQFIARVGARIVGTATLSITMGVGAGRKAWLEDFVADPNSPLKGVGQAIWNELLRWCENHDTDLHFTSRESRIAAHRFYLKNNAKIRNTTVFERKVVHEE